MEVVFIIVGILFFVVIITYIMDVITRWFGSINWGNFFLILIGGGLLLSLIFSFTAEGVLVIVGAYIILLFFALIFGKFKKDIIDTNI